MAASPTSREPRPPSGTAYVRREWHGHTATPQRLTLQQLSKLVRSTPLGSSAANAAITTQVQCCRSFSEIGQLFTEFSPIINHINITAMVCRLSKVVSPASLHPNERADLASLLLEMRDFAEQLLPSCSPRELATIAASFARLRAGDRRLMQLLLARCRLRTLRPQELSQLAWAVAKSGHNPDPAWVEELLEVSQNIMMTHDVGMTQQHDGGSSTAAASSVRSRNSSAAGDSNRSRGGRGTSSGGGAAAEAFKPQELCNLAWALAVLQRRCTLSASVPAPDGAPRRACARVDARWFAALRGAALSRLRGFCAADAAMCLWALAALGHVPPRSWLDEVALRAAALAPSMEEQHVAVVLWAVSRMHAAVADAAAAGAAGWAGHGRGGGQVANGGSNVLPRDFHSRQHDQQQQQQEEGREQQDQQAREQQVEDCQQRCHSDISGSFAPAASSGGHIHGSSTSGGPAPAERRFESSPCGLLSADASRALLSAMEERARQLLPGMSRPVLNCTLILSAFARVGARPSEAFVREALQRIHLALAHSLRESPAVPAAAAAVAASGAAPGAAAPAALERLVAHQASQDRLRAARGRVRHRGWVARDLATLCWSLSALGYRPPQPWLDGALYPAASAAMPEFRGRELSLLLYSLARLRAEPPAALASEATAAALGRAHTYSAHSSSSVIWALARLRSGFRPGAGASARLLQVFLSRVDDSVDRTHQNVASVAFSLPALVPPARLARLLGAEGHASGPELLLRLARAARDRMGQCAPTELAQLAAGFAKLRFYPGDDWMEALSRRCASVGWDSRGREWQAVQAGVEELQLLRQQQQLRRRQLQQQQQQHAANAHDRSASPVAPVAVMAE